MLVPAIDLGGTLIKGALVGPDGAVERRVAEPTRAEEGHAAVVERLAAMGRRLVRQATQANGWGPAVLGVAVPGLVDAARGVVVSGANIDWRDYPVREALRRRVGSPVEMGHDVTVAALAEHRFGAARGARLAVVAAIGTGIAAALIHQGMPIAGAHGRVAELGHLPLPWAAEPCGCGGVGCVERVGSAAAVAARYAALKAAADRDGAEAAAATRRPDRGAVAESAAACAPPGSRTTPRGGGDADAAAGVDAKRVVELVREGDPIARSVWDDAVRALAEALATVVTLFDPDRIVIGGGLSRAGEALLAPLRRQLRSRLTFQIMPEVVAASLGSDAGVVGAAITAGL
ncbi:MAG: ROK family protein [Bifidobacteriaceae bacterium]|jgi:glucokinase|nr:ROK family protein [Bifidobacteriaceae bacterium]